MSIDYTKLNDRIVQQAYDVSSAFLSEAQVRKLFQNKIDRATAMIRAQEQFRRMEQQQWNRRGLEKWYLGSLISSSWRFNSVTRNQTTVRWPSGPRQVTANLYNRGFESHPHFQVMSVWYNGITAVSKTVNWGSIP